MIVRCTYRVVFSNKAAQLSQKGGAFRRDPKQWFVFASKLGPRLLPLPGINLNVSQYLYRAEILASTSMQVEAKQGWTVLVPVIVVVPAQCNFRLRPTRPAAGETNEILVEISHI